MSVCVHACARMWVGVHACVCLSVCLYISDYLCVYVCLCACVYVY